MTLIQFEYIVALDNYRHYVTAAEKCFVTQPTLTMQVKKLEDELGVQIFDRSKKPLSPTRTGSFVIAKARQILREVNQMKEFVYLEKESLKGEYNLGIIPTLAPYLLPLFLGDFSRSNPEIKINITEMQTEEVIRHLHEGSLDIGMVVTPLEEGEMREIPMFYEPLLMYLSENHELYHTQHITPGMLNSKDVILLGEGHCFRNQALNLCQQRGENNTFQFDYKSGSIEGLKKLVQKGIGYTLVPELSVVDEMDSEFTKRFIHPQPVREVSLVVHKSFPKEKLLVEFQKHILNNIPKEFRQNENFVRVKWR
ncbi:MAG: LysR family transcriptional regulator [Bacteroidetes bacterium]|jgi:LysR family hydrogen peroxide-inducible transcriptional activator|nr:LysR family transcriptional regulator [Bacteroidota bacterium]